MCFNGKNVQMTVQIITRQVLMFIEFQLRDGLPASVRSLHVHRQKYNILRKKYNLGCPSNSLLTAKDFENIFIAFFIAKNLS